MGRTQGVSPRCGPRILHGLYLAPLLVIVIAIAGFFFGADAAKGRLSGQIESVGGNEGGNAVQTMVASAWQACIRDARGRLGDCHAGCRRGGTFRSTSGRSTHVWEVQPKPGCGILGFLRDRFLSFSMIFGTALYCCSRLWSARRRRPWEASNLRMPVICQDQPPNNGAAPNVGGRPQFTIRTLLSRPHR